MSKRVGNHTFSPGALSINRAILTTEKELVCAHYTLGVQEKSEHAVRLRGTHLGSH